MQAFARRAAHWSARANLAEGCACWGSRAIADVAGRTRRNTGSTVGVSAERGLECVRASSVHASSGEDPIHE